ncbi:hypothetical protein [Bacteroides cellulosilyticus]|uniref:hypothetical protein n=1 Tax=Bacteroides cellulosilyticus TaxID=246787 RepID=UPI0032BF8B0B
MQTYGIVLPDSSNLNNAKNIIRTEGGSEIPSDSSLTIKYVCDEATKSRIINALTRANIAFIGN